ncbi:hypothetical protein [Streptomyces sp. NPDC005538]|uniref:hypothetical protein n=1 Tax=unclassified Streptomyces TaxID=2593676 RepID=UPI0033B33FAF
MSITLFRSVSWPCPWTMAAAVEGRDQGFGRGLEAGADERSGGTEGLALRFNCPTSVVASATWALVLSSAAALG